MMKPIICILTATRAEYGLLKELIGRLQTDEKYEVRVVVTGMHLVSDFGFTYTEIEEDGIHIDEKIDILLSADTPCGVSKSMGIAMIGFADYFLRRRPNLLIVLGDRYETLAVAAAAINESIPIAHIHGGETTEGAIDEAIRHSITKMSYLHFASTEIYRARIIQLGEEPERVFNVGSLGVENIKKVCLLSKQEIMEYFGFLNNEKYVLLTFHPVTLEKGTELEQFREIILALNHFPMLKVILTKANADSGGKIINGEIDSIVTEQPERYSAYTSLGVVKYLSAMRDCQFVIGNSSSGIMEAPSFRIPTINIGDRQKGRVQADTTLNSVPNEKIIVQKIEIALSDCFREKIASTNNPYEKEGSVQRIIDCLDEFFVKYIGNVKKKFYDLQ